MSASITLFSNNTQPTGPELDNTFLAYAVFTTIPCAVSGTNSLTLAQNVNTPTLTQLTNYIQFSGVFANNNTGALALQVAGFPVLNGYKDSTTGPIAFTGGECIAGNAFTARYDSTLNAGNGGYHVFVSTALNGGTISGNLNIAGGTLSVTAGSLGVSLTSAVLTGNSLSISAVLASVTSLVVGASSTPLLRMLSGLGTLTYTVTPANSAQEQTFALAGAQIRDSITLGLGTSVPTGVGFTGYMAAAGTVSVRLINPATVTVAGFTSTIRATALGFT